VALDGSGNVFVADTFNDSVKEIVGAGGYATVNTIGSGFSDPFAVAVDGIGNVFVADFNNNAVKEMLAVNGVVPASPTIRTLASGFSGPDGVAVDGSGNVFVANYFGGTVQELVAVNGTIPNSPTIKTIGPAFNGPSNLAVDASGNLFVADTDDLLVKEIVATGGYSTIKTVGNALGFSAPEGVALTARGDVIVADALSDTVELLDYADTPALSFATTQAGATSSDSPQTVAVSNNGNANLIFSALSYPTDFSEAGGVGTDCKANSILATGASCTLSVAFTPKPSSVSGSSTPLSELVRVTTNSLNLSSAQAVQVFGTATPGAPAVTLSPTSLTFPSTGVGFTSTLPVTVTNSGFGNLNVTAISNSGANPAYFTHTSNCGGTPIAPGAHCTLQISFTPTAAGTFSAQLNITDNAAGSPHSFTVSGTAVNAPAVSLSTSSLSFPSTAVGATSTLPVTVTNTGQAALNITGIAQGGTNPSDFGHTSNCGGHSIAPGGNCTVQVTFTPASAASFSATLVLTDNAPGSPRTITLAGTGH
jgi:sugar lactone lactonase YvrE